MTDIPDCRITPTDVIIGGHPLPGLIRHGSVTVTPGGTTDVNIVTVDFIVGQVVIEETP